MENPDITNLEAQADPMVNEKVILNPEDPQEMSKDASSPTDKSSPPKMTDISKPKDSISEVKSTPKKWEKINDENEWPNSDDKSNQATSKDISSTSDSTKITELKFSKNILIDFLQYAIPLLEEVSALFIYFSDTLEEWKVSSASNEVRNNLKLNYHDKINTLLEKYDLEVMNNLFEGIIFLIHHDKEIQKGVLNLFFDYGKPGKHVKQLKDKHVTEISKKVSIFKQEVLLLNDFLDEK